MWKRLKVVAGTWPMFGLENIRKGSQITNAYSSKCNLLYPRYGLFKDGG
jgi:hypothetical protein